MPIKKGDKIKVEYTGTLDDGTVFDSTKKHGEPLEFEVGTGKLIAGFDNAVIGMEKGEKKKIRIEPKNGYGEHKKELMKTIPREQLPKNEELKAGMMIMLTLPSGIQLTANIAEMDETNVTLDMNHPLAGKNLNFEIKIIEIAS